jgi:hypothetical protein
VIGKSQKIKIPPIFKRTSSAYLEEWAFLDAVERWTSGFHRVYSSTGVFTQLSNN